MEKTKKVRERDLQKKKFDACALVTQRDADVSRFCSELSAKAADISLQSSLIK